MGCISLICFIAFLLFDSRVLAIRGNKEASFDQNYVVTWGQSHVSKLNQGQEVQLSLDQSSGAGFKSKEIYGSGVFSMRIKVPGRDSAGVVTAFYLTSNDDRHDELDFEFLGNLEGKPITLQTNIFINGVGNREQRLVLWFDPTAGFHTYKILWNQHHVVFYVDNKPIREYKNNKGAGYLSKPMSVQASLWDGESWATGGGKIKTNWSYAPFKAEFQGFDISGCPANHHNCQSTSYWWNKKNHWELSAYEQRAYETVRKKHMNYDYCSDKHGYTAHIECP